MPNHEPSASDVLDALERLFALLSWSLPRYLEDARPWRRGDQEEVAAAIGRLAAYQAGYAQRVAEAIIARGDRPEPGAFPLRFAGLNDASIGHVLGEVIQGQRRELAEIERLAARLEGQPDVADLAGEILGNARGHLEILETLAASSLAGLGDR